MDNTMKYKGYIGSIKLSEEDELFFGKVMGIRALVSYEGSSAKDLIKDFHGAVNDYLKLCSSKGIELEKAYKRCFNVRVSPELHKKAAVYAASHNITLNSFVESAMESALAI